MIHLSSVHHNSCGCIWYIGAWNTSTTAMECVSSLNWPVGTSGLMSHYWLVIHAVMSNVAWREALRHPHWLANSWKWEGLFPCCIQVSKTKFMQDPVFARSNALARTWNTPRHGMYWDKTKPWCIRECFFNCTRVVLFTAPSPIHTFTFLNGIFAFCRISWLQIAVPWYGIRGQCT